MRTVQSLALLQMNKTAGNSAQWRCTTDTCTVTAQHSTSERVCAVTVVSCLCSAVLLHAVSCNDSANALDSSIQLAGTCMQWTAAVVHHYHLHRFEEC
jgi:hypothetical protein